MTLIGIDDTDSRDGMCTTYLMARLILELREEGFDIIGYPRLVRLNPNIPYKTRGNGALCVEVGLGNGKGKRIAVGQWGGTDILGFPRASRKEGGKEEMRPDDGEKVERLLTLASRVVERMAELDSTGTDPGIVVLETRPPDGNILYRKAVQEVVTIEEAEEFVISREGTFRKYKGGRGIIGASAACAWNPVGGMDRTHEIISYRHPPSFGTPRTIDKNSVIAMDDAFPSTFNNYDHANDHIAIAPSSPCPVLHAIRGKDPAELPEAAAIIRTGDGEQPQGWMIFETNQGTDDHLVPLRIAEVKPFHSVIVGGIIREGPQELPGGHVKFTLDDTTGTIDCIAYEPTKEFRQVIRALEPDDAIMAFGGVRDEPFSVNLEKIKVIRLTERIRKVANPVCPKCGKGMKSIGTGQGFRCRGCRTRSEEEGGEYERYDTGIEPGFYEVPVCARRHLHKPLKRFTFKV